MDDTTFMKKASLEILVNGSFIGVETRGLMVFGNVKSGVMVVEVRILNKRTKTKPIRTNPGTRLEECKKTKPNAYLSLMDQPVPILLGQIQGLQMIAWALVKNQGLRLEDWDAPRALDPSSEGYIRRPPHTA
ncbi:hypothetical protein Tco_1141720 [Tanacetum coccineum]